MTVIPFSVPTSKIANIVLYLLMSYEATYCSGAEPEVWHQRLGFKSNLYLFLRQEDLGSLFNFAEPQFPSLYNRDNSPNSIVVVSLK